jgi:hypothetical protein
VQILRRRSAVKQFTENPILIGEDEQNNTSSKPNLSDFHTDSTRSTAGCLESRQTSLNTTISSSPNPQGTKVDYKVSRAAKLGETDALVAKTAEGPPPSKA